MVEIWCQRWKINLITLISDSDSWRSLLRHIPFQAWQARCACTTQAQPAKLDHCGNLRRTWSKVYGIWRTTLVLVCGWLDILNDKSVEMHGSHTAIWHAFRPEHLLLKRCSDHKSMQAMSALPKLLERDQSLRACVLYYVWPLSGCTIQENNELAPV